MARSPEDAAYIAWLESRVAAFQQHANHLESSLYNLSASLNNIPRPQQLPRNPPFTQPDFTHFPSPHIFMNGIPVRPPPPQQMNYSPSLPPPHLTAYIPPPQAIQARPPLPRPHDAPLRPLVRPQPQQHLPPRPPPRQQLQPPQIVPAKRTIPPEHVPRARLDHFTPADREMLANSLRANAPSSNSTLASSRSSAVETQARSSSFSGTLKGEQSDHEDGVEVDATKEKKMRAEVKSEANTSDASNLLSSPYTSSSSSSQIKPPLPTSRLRNGTPERLDLLRSFVSRPKGPVVGHGEELRFFKREGEEASALLDALRPAGGVKEEEEDDNVVFVEATISRR